MFSVPTKLNFRVFQLAMPISRSTKPTFQKGKCTNVNVDRTFAQTESGVNRRKLRTVFEPSISLLETASEHGHCQLVSQTLENHRKEISNFDSGIRHYTGKLYFR